MWQEYVKNTLVAWNSLIHHKAHCKIRTQATQLTDSQITATTDNNNPPHENPQTPLHPPEEKNERNVKISISSLQTASIVLQHTSRQEGVNEARGGRNLHREIIKLPGALAINTSLPAVAAVNFPEVRPLPQRQQQQQGRYAASATLSNRHSIKRALWSAASFVFFFRLENYLGAAATVTRARVQL